MKRIRIGIFGTGRGEDIAENIMHPFNLQSALAMSSVAILGHRSVLEGGKPFDIPDFTKEEDCALYENDYLTPFPGMNGEEPTIPCCSKTDFVPTQEQLKLYRELVMEEK